MNIVYRILRNDIELFPNKNNWTSLLRDMLSTLGFYEVRIF